METLPLVKIYCDGACSGNPGPGGWGAILLSGSKRKEISGGEAKTTNNRMELTAALEALKTLTKPCSVQFVTDSSYLLKGASEWLKGWKQRGWRRKEGALLNADLWQALDVELAKHQVTWQWVKGHAGHPLNERAVHRLLALKRRPMYKGLILIAADFAQLAPFLQPLFPADQARLAATWPGPYTWLIPTQADTPRWLRGRGAPRCTRWQCILSCAMPDWQSAFSTITPPRTVLSSRP